MKKVTLTMVRDPLLPLPWLKTQWEVEPRRLGLGIGIKDMVEGVGLDLWEAIKVDLTRCLLRSARTRRIKPRRN